MLSSHFACEALEVRRLLSAAVPKAQVDLPRYLTPAEQEWLKTHSLNELGGGTRVPTAPPSGPIDPVAEYEPMEGLVISWMTYTSILGQIAKRVTDVGGRMYIGVTSSSVQSSAISTLTSLNVNMNQVTFFTVPLNSVWARDYGPRYVYEGGVRVITDHQYNRPRPSDDQEPVVFSAFKKQQIYQIGMNGTSLIHGGGNFHLNASGDAYATSLITDENPSFTASQVQQIWNTYEGDNVTITGRFPTTVDSTGHIDMWMQIYDDHQVFISDWPNNPGSTQDTICDNTAALMQSRGYQVTRLPAYSIGGTHYTYTNMVIFNNVVLLPQYNNGPGAGVSSQALATVQSAFGAGKTVYAINADQIIPAAGAFHCIVQHVPIEQGTPGANGGLTPVAYLRGPNDGQTLLPGQQYDVQWITDDDGPVAATDGVQTVDILLSTDGGRTFNITVAANQPALGSFVWTIPSGINTSMARLRILAHDGAGNTGYDDSDRNFTIGTPVANGIWTGAGDGVHWSDANNWSNNTLPTIADDVFIDTPGAFTVELAGTITQVHSLTLGNSTTSSPTLSLTAGGDRLLEIMGLNINGNAKLNLNDNDLLVDYSGASPLGSIQALINTARAGGAWSGTGMTSIAAADNLDHNTTLGALEATDYAAVHGGPFDGVTPDATAVLVKYTYYGDTDFNGTVNFDDYVRTDSGFNNTRTGWLNGDFDGNGSVNFDDYVLIDLAFNTQGAAL